jgi:hypothetical protein
MAANFRILIHRNSDNLHLKLMGDFDGKSAHKVLNELKKNCHCASKVFIHTSCLKHIHPFGRDIFHNNLDFLNRQSFLITFTGRNSRMLAPEGTKIC